MTGLELEVKIKVRDLKDFERRLEGAAFLGEEEQVDTYFEMPASEMLRVREVKNRGKAYLCHKRILDAENSEFEETELEVGDAEETKLILENLGYVEYATVEKLRRIYRLDGVTLEVNDVKNAGTFVDFELMGEDRAEKARLYRLIQKLGYSEEDIDTRLYTEIIRGL